MSSAPSSRSSFHTAPASPRSVMSEDSMDAASTKLSQVTHYRLAMQLPAELHSHIHIYLDEQLYISALALLTTVLTSGASHPNALSRPAFVPPPLHIEIASTLLVHPAYTTHASPTERREIASRSINFLRNVLAIAGPVNGKLTEAFDFDSTINRRSRQRRNYPDIDIGSNVSDNEREDMNTIATEYSIRNRAVDFWHAVGWALNCSVSYTKRWKYWKVWLEYMLDVLDADWKERDRQDREDEDFKSRLKDDPDAECEYKMLRKSLVVQYLSEVKGRSSAVKRVVGAAFADGGFHSMRAYPEVFQDETEEPNVRTGQKRKRGQKVEILEHKYGDYDNDVVDDAAFDSSQPTEPLSESLKNDTDDADVSQSHFLGGPDSIALRQRLLALLSRVSMVLPESFASAKEIYNVFLDYVKTLPVPAFSLLISPSNSDYFPAEGLSSLIQLLLCRLLPNTAPRPYSISNVHRNNDSISQEIIEKCFLPFSAITSSAEDNTKVSILVESILRLFSTAAGVEPTPSLKAAIEKGITVREAKTKIDRRRKENSVKRKEEESDKLWLMGSGERLKSLLALLELNNCEIEVE